ncbi:MAG: hypothetical protein HY866_15880, partial [Chloroflexi bacterium]|nr:hypothetical protein [Chloroflexota bacterium]
MTGRQRAGRLSPGRWRELFWLLVEPAVSITSRQERRQARLLSTALLILIVISSMIQMGEFRQPGWSELRDPDFWISGASVVMFAGLYGPRRS